MKLIGNYLFSPWAHYFYTKQLFLCNIVTESENLKEACGCTKSDIWENKLLIQFNLLRPKCMHFEFEMCHYFNNWFMKMFNGLILNFEMPTCENIYVSGWETQLKLFNRCSLLGIFAIAFLAEIWLIGIVGRQEIWNKITDLCSMI